MKYVLLACTHNAGRSQMAQFPTTSVLDEHDDAPIRTDILTVAHKRTRERLREDTCAVL